uniref:Gustatory receptor n=1 Tax=Anopheles atroparvus TaxID=41427 RepID=A0A182IVL4_ANOAO
MLALFSIYFNLLLSYATGIVPLGYNFQAGRFEPRKWVAALASVLVLVWLSLNFKHKKFSTRMTVSQVGMQSVIHMVEYIVLSTNWILIGVQQLLQLENYQQRLSELLTSARSWNHRRLVGVSEHLVLLLKLVLLPVGMFSLHVSVFVLLVNFQVSILHAFLTMVTLIPNMAHVNNFYALLFAQRLTLREINGKLVNLWEERARGGNGGGIPGELQVAARLQALLGEYEQCARSVGMILRLYSMPVALYLLLLIQEIISKSRKIKSAVHRLSLIPQQNERLQETVKLFLLSLNQSTLEIKVSGMFTIDNDMLVGMLAAISNVVVFLAQFHIDYTNTVMSYDATLLGPSIDRGSILAIGVIITVDDVVIKQP